MRGAWRMARTADLKAAPRNPRKHSQASIDSVAASLRAFGQVDPVIVRGDQVVHGHGRVAAARKEGLEEIRVLDVSESMTAEEARAYAVAANRTGELSEWDPVELSGVLERLDAALADATGYSPEERAGLVGTFEVTDPNADLTFTGRVDRGAHGVYYTCSTEQWVVIGRAIESAREQMPSLEDNGAALAYMCREYAQQHEEQQG